jgi:hypothetical protein
VSAADAACLRPAAICFSCPALLAHHAACRREPATINHHPHVASLPVVSHPAQVHPSSISMLGYTAVVSSATSAHRRCHTTISALSTSRKLEPGYHARTQRRDSTNNQGTEQRRGSCRRTLVTPRPGSAVERANGRSRGKTGPCLAARGWLREFYGGYLAGGGGGREASRQRRLPAAGDRWGGGGVKHVLFGRIIPRSP